MRSPTSGLSTVVASSGSAIKRLAESRSHQTKLETCSASIDAVASPVSSKAVHFTEPIDATWESHNIVVVYKYSQV